MNLRIETEAARDRARQRIAGTRGAGEALSRIDEVAALLAAGPGDEHLSVTVSRVAEAILHAAHAIRSRPERVDEARLEGLVNDPPGRYFTVAFADRFLRPRNPETGIRLVHKLLDRYGTPRYLNRWHRFLLQALRRVGGLTPGFAHGRVRRMLMKEIARVSWPAADKALHAAIADARAGGFRVIVNHLGEQVLGDAEARQRLDKYARSLREPDIDAVSVKLSSVAARLDPYATEAIAPELVRRAEVLLEASRRPEGQEPALVMLDMEEYRDVDLTLGVLTHFVRADKGRGLRFGVVVQAYLSDSARIFDEVLALSRERVAAGERPLRIRLVKGANLAMEKVEASLRGWPQAPLPDKASVDRNYRILMRRGILAAANGELELGIGSHNLFDMALGLIWRAWEGAEAGVGFEMLAGIGQPVARVVAAISGNLTLYAPVVHSDELLAAIAYLIRRFDENTGRDNFLRNAFGMVVGDARFEAERARLAASLGDIELPPARRPIARATACTAPEVDTEAPWLNEPDTDWTGTANRAWIQECLNAFEPVAVRPRVGGEVRDGEPFEGLDPSRPGLTLFEARLAPPEVMEEAVALAQGAYLESAWLQPEAVTARIDAMCEAARLMRERRGELIAAMVAETGKVPAEADVEVSEAVDFLTWYVRSQRELSERAGLRSRGLGVTVVASPWNFPCAIGVGGIAAALLAGNPVIFKPAPEALLVGKHSADIFFDAGVPADIFHFLPCANEPTGRQLICHPDVATVVLTGGTATAQRFLQWRPSLRLFAEIGGKNSAIVMDSCDRDVAIRSVVQGAFGHAGQKCSATSLLICHADVLADPSFLLRLKDAAETMVVGSAWGPLTDVPPLIRPPAGPLKKAIETLEPGESWLLEPKVHPSNPRLVSPGIKLGVKPGSFAHQTEFFGPILAVLPAGSLEEAIDIANGTPYGLTAGLHSLDEDDHALWLDRIRAGNLYINRSTTGAIVGRQPFGGMKQSVFGPGAKAGGPNYVAQFARHHTRVSPVGPAEVGGVAEPVMPDYVAVHAAHFLETRELQGLLGQDNLFRYRPLDAVLVRFGEDADPEQGERILLAARAAGTRLFVSAAAEAGWHERLCEPVTVEDADALIARLDGLEVTPERARSIGTVAEDFVRACVTRGWYVEQSAVAADDRFEVLKYLREQSISVDYHRFGNLGDREAEHRN